MRSKFKWIFTLLVALTMQFSFAQEKTVTGVVSDDLGPIAGASVVVKGTTKGTTTDFDGNYTISAKQGDVLEISYVGNKQEVAVGAANTYNVTLSSTQLEEVVVTGALGIKRKADEVTSTYQVVSAKEIKQAANPNAVQSLAGKVTGLTINTTSNGVTPTTRIVLRGGRSVSGNNQALVVIDNVISSASVLSSLPPAAIEDVTVIKGAQGGALYGEQGINGVILVTTVKGGKNDKVTVSLNNSVDFESVAFLPERQQRYGQGWYDDQGFNDGMGSSNYHIPWENGGWGPSFNDPTMVGTMQPTGLPQADGTFIMSPWAPIDNNIKDFFKTGTIFQNGITINAGGADSYALLNVNRQKTDFVVEGDELTRNSFLFKGGKKIGKFSLDGNVNYITQSSKQTSPELYQELLMTATNIPVSSFAGGLNEHHWTVYYNSPYWLRDNTRFNNKSDYVSAIASLGYKFNKNISASYTANVRLTSANGQSYSNAFSNVNYDYTDAFVNAGYDYYGFQDWTYADLGGHGISSYYYGSQSSSRNFYGDLMINFDYELTKDLGLKFNIGNNIQDNLGRGTQNGGSNLDVDGWYHINNVLSPDPFSGLSNYYTRYRKVAFFGNADLNYKDYLFLNVTGRWEDSSVLASSYFYPSVGLSFIPTTAFPSIKGNTLNYMKLYGSYVVLGNSSNVSSYDTDNVGVIPAGFPFGNISSYAYDATKTDPAIEPEFVATAEAGINLSFFNNRITLDAAYYTQKTTDLISAQTASNASGNANLRANIGDLENKGFEVDLGLTPVKMANNGFRWDLKAGIYTSKTKITKLTDDAKSIALVSNSFVGVYAEEGEEFPLIKGTAYQRDANGNIIVNSDGVPERTSDFKILGKATPDYVLNFSTSFSYKGLKLTAMGDYRTGHQVWSQAKRELSWSGHLNESADFDREAGYVFPGVLADGTPNTNILYANSNGDGYSGVLNYYSNVYSVVGENTVIDATAFRIREIALSYELPSKLISRTGLSSLTFGVNARNAFFWFPKANENYNDPEASFNNGNGQGLATIGRYPTTKTYGFSVNLTF